MKVLAYGLLIAIILPACTADSGTLGTIDFGPTGDGSRDLTVAVTDGPQPDLTTRDLAGDMGNLAPTIVITSPLADAEVAYDTLHVVAQITSNSGVPLKADSILLSASGATVPVTMSLTAVANVYQGDIDIKALPSGPATFTVAASDLAAHSGSVVTNYIHDAGPKITFVQPSSATAKGGVTVEVIVDDTLHPITDVSQLKAGIRGDNDIVLTQVMGAVPFRATGTVNFNDYNPALDGLQVITVQATNSQNTSRRATVQLVADNTGPVITLVRPLQGVFVGGVIDIAADITDISGINQGQLQAVIGNRPDQFVELVPDPMVMNRYHGLYDVRVLGTSSYVLLTISIRAADKVGNQSHIDYQVVLDNTPMSMELDPPKMRVSKTVDGKKTCSQLFDPLGDNSTDPMSRTREAVNDGDIVDQVFGVKARIEDRGNNAPGLLVERFSGIKGSTIKLYVMPAASPPANNVALAVDTDGDGKCDAVNPLLVPTPNVTGSGQALALDMVPMAKGGTADYSGLSPGPTPMPYQDCFQIGSMAMQPERLCKNVGTNMTYVIPYSDPLSPIWTLPPVGASSCIGFQLDSMNTLPEGPACLVVTGTDLAGNTNVSPPLHICIDRGSKKCNTWDKNDSNTWPNCTGTYNKANNTVNETAHCSPFEIINAQNQLQFSTRFPRDVNNPPNGPIELRADE